MIPFSLIDGKPVDYQPELTNRFYIEVDGGWCLPSTRVLRATQPSIQLHPNSNNCWSTTTIKFLETERDDALMPNLLTKINAFKEIPGDGFIPFSYSINMLDVDGEITRTMQIVGHLIKISFDDLAYGEGEASTITLSIQPTTCTYDFRSAIKRGEDNLKSLSSWQQ